MREERRGRNRERGWGWIWLVPVLALASLSVSCGSNRAVDYEGYERIPIRPASTVFRVIGKANPLTRQAAFYGNYGGPGNRGGKPCDQMDELFRRHDLVYYLAKTRPTMLVADQVLVEKLSALETGPLDEHGRKYRARAIGFFESPMSKVVGKPVGSFLHRREPVGGYFQSPERVRWFFSEDHSGMPEVGGK